MKLCILFYSVLVCKYEAFKVNDNFKGRLLFISKNVYLIMHIIHRSADKDGKRMLML